MTVPPRRLVSFCDRKEVRAGRRRPMRATWDSAVRPPSGGRGDGRLPALFGGVSRDARLSCRRFRGVRRGRLRHTPPTAVCRLHFTRPGRRHRVPCRLSAAPKRRSSTLPIGSIGSDGAGRRPMDRWMDGRTQQSTPRQSAERSVEKMGKG